MKLDDRTYRDAAREATEARFARAVAACLSESADQLSPDLTERLRFKFQSEMLNVFNHPAFASIA